MLSCLAAGVVVVVGSHSILYCTGLDCTTYYTASVQHSLGDRKKLGGYYIMKVLSVCVCLCYKVTHQHFKNNIIEMCVNVSGPTTHHNIYYVSKN